MIRAWSIVVCVIVALVALAFFAVRSQGVVRLTYLNTTPENYWMTDPMPMGSGYSQWGEIVPAHGSCSMRGKMPLGEASEILVFASDPGSGRPEEPARPLAKQVAKIIVSTERLRRIQSSGTLQIVLSKQEGRLMVQDRGYAAK